MQKILSGDVSELAGAVLETLSCERFLLVCGTAFPQRKVEEIFDPGKVPYIRFDRFTPNPLYEEICEGVRIFNEGKCDTIIAIGGGSALDTAKCIKLYCGMNQGESYLEQRYKDSGIPLVAIPTTAGTGSESTQYAVIYYHGQKQSVTHESIIPAYVILDAGLLETLPLYQKKCTLMDALCQGIESWWSVNSTEESRRYSRTAIEMIMKNMDAYLFGHDHPAAEQILLAANYSGQAINIAQTTAPHAMSYKLTSMYGLPHGHSVAVCLPEVWEYMEGHPNECVDRRGQGYLAGILGEISGYITPGTFRSLLLRLGLQAPCSDDRDRELCLLTDSVNPVRLKNNPVRLDRKVLRMLYERIVMK